MKLFKLRAWLDKQNEIWWNRKRIVLEDYVEQAVRELSVHMGTNKFHLPFDGFNVKVNYE